MVSTHVRKIKTTFTVDYRQLQIRWHRILTLFLKLCSRNQNLPMGFTISTM